MLETLAVCAVLTPDAPPARVAWGDMVPSSVVLRADDTALAVVEFHNGLSVGDPGDLVLIVGGLSVGVRIDFGQRRVPDVLHVDVPEQYIAVPPSLVVDDDTTGVVRIYCREDMPLG